jgi:hypothetical protein
MFPSLDLFLSTMAEVLAAATGRNPQHKKGSIRDWRLSWAIGASLFYLPKKYGGEPAAFDKKKVGGGRKFQEALKLLRKCVAPGIIPDNLSLTTIKRIRDQALGVRDLKN